MPEHKPIGEGPIDDRRRIRVVQVNRHEEASRGGLRVLIALIAAVGLVLVVSDDEWKWRDTLRRLLEGEETPAFRASEWKDLGAVRASLDESLLASARVSSCCERDVRRSLALYALVEAAGPGVFAQGGDDLAALMEELGTDVDWLEEIAYCCPPSATAAALPILATIYRVERKGMDLPECRRFAAAVAFEFARAGLGAEEALAHYSSYAAGGRLEHLNSAFPSLSIWEMRVLAARGTNAQWGNPTCLGWFRRNGRQPAQDYVRAGDILGAHEVSLFGEQVDTADFRAIYRDAAQEGAALVYETSGCSTALGRAHYAASAACANGVPALVAARGAESVCMVALQGRWVSSSPVPWDASCSWAYMGQQHPDFIRLVAALGAEPGRWRDSACLAQMGQFHFSKGNKPLSHACFREALKRQPLNAAAWQAYRACAAPADELAAAAGHFVDYPAVAQWLRTEAEAPQG